MTGRMKFRDVDVDAVLKLTEKGAKVVIGERELWIPRSNLSYVCDRDIVETDEPTTIKVVDWFCIEKEI